MPSKPCSACGKPITRPASHLKGNVYCDRLCSERKKKEYLELPDEKTCLYCTNTFRKSPKVTWAFWKDQKYCRHQCYANSLIGKKNEQASMFFTRAWREDPIFQEKMRNRLPHSAFTRAKISAAGRGRVLTEEHKSKVGRSGVLHHMYGKKHSAESLQKMSMSKKGSITTEHTKALLSRIMSGRKLSTQTRQKISIITTNQWKDPDQRRRKLKGLEKAAWKGSKLEHKVASILEELSIPYERHRGLSFCIPDFYLPANQGFIEVDGAYWHRTEKQIRKDLRNTKRIQGMGYAILRIPEIEVKEGRARQSILNFINK